MKTTTLLLSAAVAAGLVSTVTLSSAEAAFRTHEPLGSDNFAPIVLVVNKDQFEGKWKQFKGELKKKWGKFTDDDLLVIEGNYDKFEGKVQERYGNRKEEVNRWTEEWFENQNSSDKR